MGAGTLWRVMANGVSASSNEPLAESTGSGKEFNIVPPYTVVYGWKRVA